MIQSKAKIYFGYFFFISYHEHKVINIHSHNLNHAQKNVKPHSNIGS